MAAPVRLRDVSHGRPPSRLRILAPLRYLGIKHPEKNRYDYVIPLVAGVMVWILYWCVEPKPPLFGDGGLLRFARDLLIMAVPFMVGALAAVAMGSPGQHMDNRPRGINLSLDGRALTLRQFVCYQLGYLSFLGLVTLAAVVFAGLMHDSVVSWVSGLKTLSLLIRLLGTLGLSLLLSALTVTVLWSLYFLTDIVNRTD